MSVNPSAEVARRVAASPRWRRLGIEAEALVMPTAYAAIEAVLAPALAGGFDAVLMIGVAGRARHVRVERRAANRASLLSPDVERRRRTAPALAPGPSHRASRAGATAALARLRRAGLPCRLSQDAGATSATHPISPRSRRRCRCCSCTSRGRRGGDLAGPARSPPGSAGTSGSPPPSPTSPSTSSAPRAEDS